MCNKETIERFKQIFDEYCNLPDDEGSKKALVSMLIKLLFSILIKLLIKVVKNAMEE